VLYCKAVTTVYAVQTRRYSIEDTKNTKNAKRRGIVDWVEVRPDNSQSHLKPQTRIGPGRQKLPHVTDVRICRTGILAPELRWSQLLGSPTSDRRRKHLGGVQSRCIT